ncbi:hypothetical protein [Pantoea septica]|uniref:hypothetical protein n=1 Tax=Pantoea septica TaxID=472695 RepID=UPI0029143C52|nr:hypothetical protein [Pantoea sp.]
MKNVWAWILAVSPLILFLPFNWIMLLVVYAVVVVVCAAFDRKNLVQQGYMAPSMWNVVIPAIYLRRRADLVEGNLLLVLVWVAVMVGSFLLAGYYVKQDGLASGACDVVTQIVEKNDISAKCVKVNITEKVTDDFYKANAILDNGRELRIVIKRLDDNKIYVTIPPQF